MDANIAKLKEWIAGSDNIVFFGGAGVSTESGIPDFRSPGGLWERHDPMEVATVTALHRNPRRVWEFLIDALASLGQAKPNPGHFALARLEREGRLAAVVTQNIDGLHQAAGSKNVLELHGSILRAYCSRCGRPYPAERMNHGAGVPKCECGGVIRPDIVLYEEPLDDDIVSRAVSAIRQADVLIVGGTSLNVYPAAGLINYYQGHRLALVNLSATPYDRQADLVIHEKIGEVFGQV